MSISAITITNADLLAALGTPKVPGPLALAQSQQFPIKVSASLGFLHRLARQAMEDYWTQEQKLLEKHGTRAREHYLLRLTLEQRDALLMAVLDDALLEAVASAEKQSGDSFTFDAEAAAAFRADQRELLGLEVQLQVRKLNISDLDGSEAAALPSLFEALWFLFE